MSLPVNMRHGLLAAAALALTVAACTGGGDSREGASGGAASESTYDDTPAYGDAIVNGTIGDASNLIPMVAGDSASHTIAGYLFDGLVTYDKTLSHLEPRLAERWDISEDGLSITFHLRKDVQWTDGEPFTAHDVEFGFNLIRDPNTLTAYAEDYRQVDSFELIDDHTFRVTYGQPFAPALASWGYLVVLPKHLLEGQNINETGFGRHPIGLGSHKFESWETNTRISLVANHDYYRGRPYIEKVVSRVIPDLATQFLELKSGGIDTMGLTPVQYQRQTDTKRFSAEFNKYRYVGNGYTYLGYNLQRPVFQDVRVRRALTHAINKQELVDGVLLGLGHPSFGPYKPGTRWQNENVRRYPFDPDRSRALLGEAGWTDSDGDGVLDRDGERFSFTILTNQGNESRLKTATIVQKRFRDVGVDVAVRVVEWSAFLKEFVDKRKFDTVILGWSLSPDPDQYDIWHSSKTGAKEFNFVSYANDEVDGLLEKGRRAFDPNERKRYYDRFQEILAEEQPYSFLYVPEALPVVQQRFHGIEPAPSGIGHNFHEWYVPKALQKHAIAN